MARGRGEAGGGADAWRVRLAGASGSRFGETVGEVVGGGGVEDVAEEAGADAADAEAGGLFGGEDEEFDGAAGVKPDSLRERMASRPPRTPTVPSYMPAWGMASVWEPVPTAGRVGSEPGKRMKVLPMASVRIWKPAVVAREAM